MDNAVLICKASHTETVSPVLVVLSTTKCGSPDAVLPVLDNHQSKLESNFTVCLHKAFLQGYSNAAQFVEWVEVNRIFGADKFLVYNFTGSHILQPYIDYYVNVGLVEFHQWPAHEFEQRIPSHMYIGQTALIHDCIYRSMYKSKYLILVDVDEIIVPQKHKNWHEMLAADTTCKDEPDRLVRNSFFLRESLYDGKYIKNPPVNETLDTLTLTHRVNFTFPCPLRTKIIMQPRMVATANVHVTRDLVNGKSAHLCCMPDDLVRMHHYRKWYTSVNQSWVEEMNKAGTYHDYWDKVIEDKRMTAFAEDIHRHVAKVYKQVGEKIG